MPRSMPTLMPLSQPSSMPSFIPISILSSQLRWLPFFIIRSIPTSHSTADCCFVLTLLIKTMEQKVVTVMVFGIKPQATWCFFLLCTQTRLFFMEDAHGDCYTFQPMLYLMTMKLLPVYLLHLVNMRKHLLLSHVFHCRCKHKLLQSWLCIKYTFVTMVFPLSFFYPFPLFS